MYEKMTLQQYNEILAGKSPTPGGGSALAVVGTIACSLVEMSINVTLTKLTEKDEETALLQTELAFFGRAKSKLQQLADQDAAAFQRIIDCRHLPKDTDEQIRTRQAEMQKAYHKAALVPLDLMRISTEALQRAKKNVFSLLYKYVASDCKIGMDLFGNIVQNSMENVYANTCLVTDSTLKATLEKQGQDIVFKVNNL